MTRIFNPSSMKIKLSELRSVIRETLKARALLDQVPLLESEVYVGPDGWAYDDEGNRFRAAGAAQGVHKGSSFRSNFRASRPAYTPPTSSAPKTTFAGTSTSPDAKQVSDLLMKRPNNNFLLSLDRQLKSGRTLSDKQRAILDKIAQQ